jgi:hypothetical protein
MGIMKIAIPHGTSPGPDGEANTYGILKAKQDGKSVVSGGASGLVSFCSKDTGHHIAKEAWCLLGALDRNCFDFIRHEAIMRFCQYKFKSIKK